MKPHAIAAIAAAAISLPAFAQQRGADHQVHHDAAQIAQAEPMAVGEVRKVDKDAKKITIRHGPIQSLDMPAMTMVFQVKDQAMLDRVKAGDKVKFSAEKLGGAFTVTRIEAAK